MTHAERMADKYADLLEKIGGLDRITVDGQTYTYADLEAKYQFWARKVARQKGTRPAVATHNLGSAF